MNHYYCTCCKDSIHQNYGEKMFKKFETLGEIFLEINANLNLLNKFVFKTVQLKCKKVKSISFIKIVHHFQTD